MGGAFLEPNQCPTPLSMHAVRHRHQWATSVRPHGAAVERPDTAAGSRGSGPSAGRLSPDRSSRPATRYLPLRCRATGICANAGLQRGRTNGSMHQAPPAASSRLTVPGEGDTHHRVPGDRSAAQPGARPFRPEGWESARLPRDEADHRATGIATGHRLVADAPGSAGAGSHDGIGYSAGYKPRILADAIT